MNKENIRTFRFNWNALEMRLQAALSRADRRLLEPVKAAVPDLVDALRELVTSFDATPAQRLRACELLFVAWSRAAKLESGKEQVDAVKETAAARRAHAAAIAKSATVQARRERRLHETLVRQERKRIDKILASVQVAKKQTSSQTEGLNVN